MSDALIDELVRRTAVNRAQEYVATIASLSPFEVTFRGQRLAAVNAMPWYCHIVGDQVRVIRSDAQLVVYATLAKLPILATVSAYASGTANVTVLSADGRTFDAQIEGTGWTPAVNDKVRINWTAVGPFVARRGGPVTSPADPPQPPDYLNSGTPPDTPAPPPPSSTTQTVILYAQQIACYLNTATFTGDQARYWVYSGQHRSGNPVTGFWFYGDQISKITGGTVSKIEIWLQRFGPGAAGALTFPLVQHNTRTVVASKPATTGTFHTGISLAMNQSGWFTLPTAWGQNLANSTTAGVASVMNTGDSYKAVVGLVAPPSYPTSKNVLSGALRVTYKRS